MHCRNYTGTVSRVLCRQVYYSGYVLIWESPLVYCFGSSIYGRVKQVNLVWWGIMQNGSLKAVSTATSRPISYLWSVLSMELGIQQWQ